jgi:hypothetical protein
MEALPRLCTFGTSSAPRIEQYNRDAVRNLRGPERREARIPSPTGQVPKLPDDRAKWLLEPKLDGVTDNVASAPSKSQRD